MLVFGTHKFGRSDRWGQLVTCLGRAGQLASRGLLPGEHLVDSGYPFAELIVHAARTWLIRRTSLSAG